MGFEVVQLGVLCATTIGMEMVAKRLERWRLCVVIQNGTGSEDEVG